MAKLSLNDLKGELKPLSEVEQRAMGRQLTEQYERTQLAALEIVAFGAMCMEVEAAISATRGTDGEEMPHAAFKRGRGHSTGLKPWLAKYAPEVGYSNARRYRDIAEALQGELTLKSAEQLKLIATTAAKPKLEPKLAKKRERLVDLVSDKSVRGLQAELGLVDDLGPRSHHPAKKLSPEERRESWKSAARANAIHAFDCVHRLEERWKLLTDDQLALAHKNAARLAKEIAQWLATPPDKRAALQLDKYLGEEAAS